MFLRLKTLHLKTGLKLNINVSFISFISSVIKEMKATMFSSLRERRKIE